MGSVDCRSRFMAISLDVAGILQDPNEFAKRRGDKNYAAWKALAFLPQEERP